MTTTTDQLREKLKAEPCGYTYDGIRVIELGDAGEWLITIGHVDKTAFANAIDAYYREVNGDDWPRAGVAEIAEETAHQKARIDDPDEFLYGDGDAYLGEGDVDVTVWVAG